MCFGGCCFNEMKIEKRYFFSTYPIWILLFAFYYSQWHFCQMNQEAPVGCCCHSHNLASRYDWCMCYLTEAVQSFLDCHAKFGAVVHQVWSGPAFSPLIVPFKDTEKSWGQERGRHVLSQTYIKEGKSVHCVIRILSAQALYVTANSTTSDSFSVKLNCSASQTSANPVPKRVCCNCCLEMKLHTQPRQYSLVCSWQRWELELVQFLLWLLLISSHNYMVIQCKTSSVGSLQWRSISPWEKMFS